ncbi:MAG: NlpC/P60 family protein, partial [Candidatus Paceibacterales bacterium]
AYIVLTKNNVPMLSDDRQWLVTGRFASIYPLIIENKKHFKSVVAVANDKRQAVLKTVLINKDDAAFFPIRVTPKKMAHFANNMMGSPYGWGGLYGYRDCSSTLQDLFSPFGLWLPRNSREQAKSGQVIHLEGVNAAQKEQILKDQAIPFFSLLKSPGHIMLYIGQKEREFYVFHTVWGVPTRNVFSTDGRAVIGKTVITSLNLGRGYINVPKVLIDKVQTLTLLDYGES